MTTQTMQDKVKGQIVAFLFNTRADVIRGEMYRALCLYVLNAAGMPSNIDQIVDLIAYTLGPKVEKTASLKTIILDEIGTLVVRGEVLAEGGLYSLNRLENTALPDDAEEAELRNAIYEEIRSIALLDNPSLSDPQTDRLFAFYLHVCDLVAKERMARVAKLGDYQASEIEYEALTILVQQAREDFNVDQLVDGGKFLRQCFAEPPVALSKYGFILVQVNIIMQLLAWDPFLDQLRQKVLEGKTIYLDTSILFSIMLQTDPKREFLTTLISATIKELGVSVRVHDMTLQEYDAVIRSHTFEFQNQHRTLREIVDIAQRDGVPPSKYVSDNIFSDYVYRHSQHIDIGSWQRFTNEVGSSAILAKLELMGVTIDRQNLYVPSAEFFAIKANMYKASLDQAKRTKRIMGKGDVTHDSRLFYLIRSKRRKRSELSFGYDTYLITLDGSLPIFVKYQGISWLETYFMFPNQWYEVAFPFLRIQVSENPGVTTSYASMSFSAIFPRLEQIIPLHIFGYVFDHGGANLTLHSVQDIVSTLMEERITERLDPANKNLREREEAKLRLERMIADSVLKEKNIVGKLEHEIRLLEEDKGKLVEGIEKTKQDLAKLNRTAETKEAEVTYLDTALKARRNVDDIYKSSEELRKEVKAQFEAQLGSIEEKHTIELTAANEAIKKKDQLLASQVEKLTSLEAALNEIRNALQRDHDDKVVQRKKAQRNFVAAKKAITTVLMVFGVLASVVLFLSIDADDAYLLSCLTLMILGITLYHWVPNMWWSFGSYGLGLLVVAGFLLVDYKLESLLWLIPMAWEILVFTIERILSGRSGNLADNQD